MHVHAGGVIFELMGRYFILPSACVVDRPVRITLFNFIARSRSIRGYALPSKYFENSLIRCMHSRSSVFLYNYICDE